MRRVQTWSIGEFEVVAATDQGRNGENQDAYCVVPGPPLRVGVFDGVGGHANGRAAAEAGARALARPDWAGVIESLVGATRGATTAIVAEIEGGRVRLHWSGDSAAFVFGPKVRPLSSLHRDLRGRPTTALGLGESMSRTDQPLPGPVLLCTDGLHDWIASWPEPAADLRAWAASLIDSARAAGSGDDATLVLVRQGGAKVGLIKEAP